MDHAAPKGRVLGRSGMDQQEHSQEIDELVAHLDGWR
jgi:hypothetical protein